MAIALQYLDEETGAMAFRQTSLSRTMLFFGVLSVATNVSVAYAAKQMSGANVSAPIKGNKSNKFTNEPSGVISFDKPHFDFGTIKRGQKLSAVFTFTNIGKGPLTIQGVQASCDCTTVTPTKGKVFQPAETGSIEVLFDSRDYSGKITKALTVITNEQSMSDRTLSVTATVNSEIDANPPLADFGEIVANKLAQQTIRVKGNMATELKIEKLRYNEEFLDVGYTKEGQNFVIYVKLKATVPIGFFKDTIWVQNNSTALPEMPIPVRATIQGQIGVAPAYVEFGSIATTEKSSRQMALTSLEGFDVTSNIIELNLNGVKSDEGQHLLQIRVAPADKNAKKISLELQNPGGKSGSVHGKVTLQTTNPQQKNVTFDFYAFFR
jgi:Protein of unknown function (DUF1573)